MGCNVPPAQPGEQEERTRVTCNLPIKNAAEEKAFKEIIAHLDRLQTQQIGVDGYTYSVPTAFVGRWWSTSPASRVRPISPLSTIAVHFRMFFIVRLLVWLVGLAIRRFGQHPVP